MVRNIDLPEAIIFYDTVGEVPSVLLDVDGTPRSGLLDLLQDCRNVQTPAFYISRNPPPPELAPLLIVSDEVAPRTRSLWETLHSRTIQPAGFGGSAGFGRKLADPERSPLPKHAVVFCADIDVCRAARAVGMRVISLRDNDLADAIIDDYSNLYLEDVATPGSFWLNPPYPRDDDGNKVDVVRLLEDNSDYYSTATLKLGEAQEDGGLSDDALQAILNDMDSL